MSFTLGIDYGTNSVRALVVRCADGAELGTCVVDYPSGRQGILLDPKDHHLARQHPGDYLFGLEKSVKGALAAAKKRRGFDAGKIIGIGVDTTGSSPIPVDRNNRPLALDRKWKRNLAAQCWLWKDHTGWREAARITELAAKHRPRFIAKCGNTYSSEWWWSKIWHCLAVAPEVFDAAYSWVELADWVPAVLAGVTDPTQVKRGVCPAGHKALYCEGWGGLPDKEFLALLDPKLASLRDRLYEKAYDATEPAGRLCEEWARKTRFAGRYSDRNRRVRRALRRHWMRCYRRHAGQGHRHVHVRLRRGVPPKRQVPDIPGICGIVKGAILPGDYGLEAGQSAVGDIFRWWVEVVCEGEAALHARLTREAARLKPGESGLLALDWNNGNRTILVDQTLSGLLLGQTLHTTRAEIYRALIEATAFGARAIIERFREYRRADRPRGVRRRYRGEESAADANLRRCHRMHDARGRLQPSLRAGLGGGGGGAGGRPSGFRRGAGSDDLAQAGAVPAARGRAEDLPGTLHSLPPAPRFIRRTQQIHGPVARDEGPARAEGSPIGLTPDALSLKL